MRRLVTACSVFALTWLVGGCAGGVTDEAVSFGGELPTDLAVRATGIGRPPGSGGPAGQARLMAGAAAEADALARLAIAVHGQSGGRLHDVRRVSTVRLEGGWSLVTMEVTVATPEQYVLALRRLNQMEPALMKALSVQPAPSVTEVIENSESE